MSCAALAGPRPRPSSGSPATRSRRSTVEMWRAWICAWTRGGDFYVLEVNPLPGLTPEYSDLCLIAKAANIDYAR